ncbi:CO or xanthine dehydrogenase, FAD-binding subunit [Marinitoga hydrogenitolerans DSM 16785]|uniref:CO or xanthine dehydrogenase, FAD-binding subunit n=1 Tax=Marinitoga hydrogenitolerans (strain DSM 16785 / JCM 12826 / AT1271) TaxID=1122195 RepID=A0A1M4T3J7_MARH1|nr:FAD binding domain-containing protein [Marinitoga hydrogenitolerans]SHE38984.1 CO or xanthine dehydrogenase, FAD-binding subunit [Marinitoga hydrogenitolerans DSM 16785]
MIEIKEYFRPKSVEEAYDKLISTEGAEIIGSGAFIRLSSRKINLAIDLQDAGINYVKKEGNEIKIGGATPLGDVERNEIIKKAFDGKLLEVFQLIWSVQLRNTATIGGTIFPKLGFSDLITVLLALNTDVVLYENGRMPLEVFLEEKIRKDVLTEIIIKDEDRKLSFQNMRNSFYDFSMLNAAVSYDKKDDFRIAIGARPGVAKLAKKAMNYLKENKNIEEASKIAAEEFEYGSNIKCSKEYREAIAPILVKRGLEEVLK